MKNEILEQLARKVEETISETQVSQAQLAKNIGISPSYITHLLKRNFNAIPVGGGQTVGFSEKVARVIMLFYGLDGMVWQTENFKMGTTLLTECKYYKEHRILDGAKGAGKTYLSQQFLKNNGQETFIVTCSEDMTPKSFMVALARVVGAPTIGDRRTIRLSIQDRIRKMKNALIAIDEAENLRPSAYGSIKALYDDLKDYCGMVLIGSNNYFDFLTKKAKSGKGCFPQIVSRFSSNPVFLLEKSMSEVKDICSLYGITDNKTVRSLHDASDDFRELDRNIKRHLKDLELSQQIAA